MSSNDFFYVDKHKVGGDSPCYVIAEVGLAHDGSLGSAHAFIDAIAKTGADAVKFQTHIAEAESSPGEPFRVDIFPQDKNRYDYWKRTAFTKREWIELKQHSEDKNLTFMSTPFSVQAVQLLREIGVKVWKVGSGEVNNLLLIDELIAGNEPIILSSGMSFLNELDHCVSRIKNKNTPLLLMQCTNLYPCPAENLGLNMIPEYQNRFKIPVGFSDHSGEIGPILAAVTLGAKAVELHVTWHKDCFGADVKSSLTLDELSILVKNIRILDRANSNPINKDLMTEDMKDMRFLFNKSLVAKKNIIKGEFITKELIDAKKPCIGIPAYDYEKVIGKKSNRDISINETILWVDLE
jgi:N,N'-diacetyllegionaminate synthase